MDTGKAETKKSVVVTPLMQFLKEKHAVRAPEARKAPAQRKSAASGRIRNNSSALASIGEDGEDASKPAPSRKAAGKAGAKAKEAQVSQLA